MEETWKHVSVRWQQREFQLWAGERLHEPEPGFERGPQNLKDTFRRLLLWPVRQKQIDTSWTALRCVLYHFIDSLST